MWTPELTIQENRANLARVVEETAIYASKVEIEGVRGGIVILSWDTDAENKVDISEKWLFDKYLPRVENTQVILLKQRSLQVHERRLEMY